MRLLPSLLVVVLAACSDKPAPAPAPVKPVPAPAPVKPVPVKPAPAPATVACFEFPSGITIITSEAQLRARPRVVRDGCPVGELPETGLDFDAVALVVARQPARCQGYITLTGVGFVWGERGGCEATPVLEAAGVVPKRAAAKLQLIKMEL